MFGMKVGAERRRRRLRVDGGGSWVQDSGDNLHQRGAVGPTAGAGLRLVDGGHEGGDLGASVSPLGASW